MLRSQFSAFDGSRLIVRWDAKPGTIETAEELEDNINRANQLYTILLKSFSNFIQYIGQIQHALQKGEFREKNLDLLFNVENSSSDTSCSNVEIMELRDENRRLKMELSEKVAALSDLAKKHEEFVCQSGNAYEDLRKYFEKFCQEKYQSFNEDYSKILEENLKLSEKNEALEKKTAFSSLINLNGEVDEALIGKIKDLIAKERSNERGISPHLSSEQRHDEKVSTWEDESSLNWNYGLLDKARFESSSDLDEILDERFSDDDHVIRNISTWSYGLLDKARFESSSDLDEILDERFSDDDHVIRNTSIPKRRRIHCPDNSKSSIGLNESHVIIPSEPMNDSLFTTDPSNRRMTKKEVSPRYIDNLESEMKLLRERFEQEERRNSLLEIILSKQQNAETPLRNKLRMEEINVNNSVIEDLKLRLKKIELKFKFILESEVKQRQQWKKICLAAIKKKVEVELQYMKRIK